MEVAGKAGLEEVRQLIQDGADINAKDKNKSTPLMSAAEYNTNPEVLKVLLEADTDVNAQSKNGWTPLMHVALYNTNPEVLKVLLEAGADVNAKEDRYGSTPLNFISIYNI